MTDYPEGSYWTVNDPDGTAVVYKISGSTPVNWKPETCGGRARRVDAAPGRCPECGGELEDRGPFDGTQASAGVPGGHEGFGGTVMCPAGHWYASIQGALVPPQHILTVLEPGGLKLRARRTPDPDSEARASQPRGHGGEAPARECARRMSGPAGSM